MKSLFHFLGLLWCLPMAVVGWLFYILPFWIIFGDLQKQKSHYPWIAVFRVNTDIVGYIPWHIRRWKRFRGFAWVPGAIIYRDDTGTYDDWYIPVSTQHEYRHQQQWYLLGPLLVLAYPLASLWALLRGKDPYRDNWFERDARRYAGEE